MRPFPRFWLLLAPVLLPGETPVRAQQLDLSAVADTVFARWNSTHTPGCAVGVARDGQVLLTKGYGMADIIENIEEGVVFPLRKHRQDRG